MLMHRHLLWQWTEKFNIFYDCMYTYLCMHIEVIVRQFMSLLASVYIAMRIRSRYVSWLNSACLCIEKPVAYLCVVVATLEMLIFIDAIKRSDLPCLCKPDANITYILLLCFSYLSFPELFCLPLFHTYICIHIGYMCWIYIILLFIL